MRKQGGKNFDVESRFWSFNNPGKARTQWQSGAAVPAPHHGVDALGAAAV
jgi:hypothetical protein